MSGRLLSEKIIELGKKMSNKKIVLFGGDHELLEITKFYFEEDGGREIVAITMDREFIQETSMLGVDVVPFDKIESTYPKDSFEIFVALSYSGVNNNRRRVCEKVASLGYTMPSYVSSKATVFSTFVHGYNCFILENNTIQPFARIGNGVTLWSGNHIGHHSVINDFCFISSHVVISGAVNVGESTFIGVNSTINDSLKIGKECIIGSGALVRKDIDDFAVLSANPAKISKIQSYHLSSF